MDMNETLSARAKRILGYLAVSIFLAGACISLASMEVDPTKWPNVCRPIFVLITFLFFQWLHNDVEKKASEDSDSIQKFKNFKKRKDVK